MSSKFSISTRFTQTAVSYQNPITGTVTFDATKASFINSDICTVVGTFIGAPFYTSPSSEEVDFGRQVVGITVSEVALYFATPVTASYSGGAVDGFVYSFRGITLLFFRSGHRISHTCTGASLLASALGDIARARGMTEIAKTAGITREALYKVPEVSGVETGGLALLLGGVAMLRGRRSGPETSLSEAE